MWTFEGQKILLPFEAIENDYKTLNCKVSKVTSPASQPAMSACFLVSVNYEMIQSPILPKKGYKLPNIACQE